MQFGQLQFFWFMILVPLVGVFLVYANKKKAQAIELFVSAELKDRLLASVSPRKQKLKQFYLLLALFLAVLALTRPKYGFHWQEISRKGVDIMIALDVSQSMLAEDVQPNRLERAKREIIDLLRIVEGDRIGLVAFAGTSFLQCPLTLDYGAVQIFLDELDTNLIPIPGTAIADAIEKSISAYSPQDKSARALILITDGEDHLGKPLEAATKANEENVKIYAIGIGKEGGAPIPDKETGGFKKNRRGEVVMSKFDEDVLQKIALATGGSYARSTSGNMDFAEIYKDIKDNLQDKELQSGRRKRYEERFQWPLLLAILFLMIELLSSERKGTPKGRRRFSEWKTFFKKSSPLFFAAFIGAATSADLWALDILGGKEAEGTKLYEQGDYQQALNKLLDAQIENPTDLGLKYNLANTYYKLKDWENAEKLYQEVVRKGSGSLAAKAEYNLGNTAVAQGKLEEAIAHYEAALKLNPEDKDAKHNLEFVREEIKRLLEEQKKRQEQQQQGGDGKQQEKQDGQNGQDKQEQNKEQNQEQQQQDGKDKQQQSEQQQEEQKAEEAKKDEKGSGKEKEEQDKKEQKGQEGTEDKEKKDQEQKAAAQEAQQNEEDKDKANKEDKNENDKAGAQSQAQETPGQEKEDGMSEEEAMRWLNNLKDDRKEYIQRKLKGQKHYKVDKDW